MHVSTWTHKTIENAHPRTCDHRTTQETSSHSVIEKEHKRLVSNSCRNQAHFSAHPRKNHGSTVCKPQLFCLHTQVVVAPTLGNGPSLMVVGCAFVSPCTTDAHPPRAARSTSPAPYPDLTSVQALTAHVAGTPGHSFFHAMQQTVCKSSMHFRERPPHTDQPSVFRE